MGAQSAGSRRCWVGTCQRCAMRSPSAMGRTGAVLWDEPVPCYGEHQCRAVGRTGGRAAPCRAVLWGFPVPVQWRSGAGARRIPPPRGRCAPERRCGRRQLLRTARGGRDTAGSGQRAAGNGTGADPGECGRAGAGTPTHGPGGGGRCPGDARGGWRGRGDGAPRTPRPAERRRAQRGGPRAVPLSPGCAARHGHLCRCCSVSPRG